VSSRTGLDYIIILPPDAKPGRHGGQSGNEQHKAGLFMIEASILRQADSISSILHGMGEEEGFLFYVDISQGNLFRLCRH
jgi:hypothetical protein